VGEHFDMLPELTDKEAIQVTILLNKLQRPSPLLQTLPRHAMGDVWDHVVHWASSTATKASSTS
jgi:hypothetical protein